MREKMPTKAQVEEARRFIEANRSLIILHTLYLRWGLPTKPLSILTPKES